MCTANNTDIQQREEVSTTQALMENSRYCYVQQSLNIQKDNNMLWLHNVRSRVIYLSLNLWACSHLGYKVQGVAFYANNMMDLFWGFLIWIHIYLMIRFLRTSSHQLEIEIGDMHTDIWKNDLWTVPSGFGIGETIYLMLCSFLWNKMELPLPLQTMIMEYEYHLPR